MFDLQTLLVPDAIVPVSSNSRLNTRIAPSPWPQIVRKIPPARYYSTSITLYESFGQFRLFPIKKFKAFIDNHADSFHRYPFLNTIWKIESASHPTVIFTDRIQVNSFRPTVFFYKCLVEWLRRREIASAGTVT